MECWVVFDCGVDARMVDGDCTRLQDQLGRGGCGAALGGGTRAVSSLECSLIRENALDSNNLNVGSRMDSSLSSIEEKDGHEYRIHGDGGSSQDVSEGSLDDPSLE